MSEKSFKTVARDAMFVSLSKSIESIKHNNIDNGILRECKAIHGNTTFDDLPPYLRAALNQAVESFLAKMVAEGYKVETI